MNDAQGQSIRQKQLERKKAKAQAVKEAKRRDELRRGDISPPMAINRVGIIANEELQMGDSFSPDLGPSAESWTAIPPSDPTSTLELMFDPGVKSEAPNTPVSPESEAILAAAVAAADAIEARAAAEKKAEVVAAARAALVADAEESDTEHETRAAAKKKADVVAEARAALVGDDSTAMSEDNDWSRGQEIRRIQMERKKKEKSDVVRARADDEKSTSHVVPETSVPALDVETTSCPDTSNITPRQTMDAEMAEPPLKNGVSLHDVSRTSRGCRGCLAFSIFSSSG